MGTILCSYGGNETVSAEESEIRLSEPYGGTSTVLIKDKVCSHCGCVEDDVDDDLIVQKKLSVLKRPSTAKILDALIATGHTDASMERASKNEMTKAALMNEILIKEHVIQN
ncbi:MAG: hypothetical protein RBS30_03160 [Sphaerochaetaceae bacterium]|jgi:hypothetical protein|nr:hypothetical protein [Sphaerochaetaceae bacterium]